ncbi:site-specific integrase [Lentimicrobium sp. S6]|uniref:tyrosine-type recombinase/integrase n=1 Tax=Lentimicrobium sp. S6 TaxID=2735872 RepID=UPI001552E2B5|nr:site-specific integrase [Lentimicrobium sp. S6]NPD47116.1 site-specific integrase [Lentimicrobium sp. S6]
MTNIKFRLKNKQSDLTPSKQESTSIFLLASYGYFDVLPDGGKKYRRLKYYTGYKILPYLFVEKKNRVKEQKQVSNPNGTIEIIDYKKLNRQLDNIEVIAKNILIEHSDKAPEIIREMITEKLNPSHLKMAKTLTEFMDARIKELKATNKEGFSKGTIKAHNSFVNIFKEFNKYQNKAYDFNDIDLNFYTDYTNYLYSVRKYKDNTVGNHIKNIKSYMELAKDEGLHSNLLYTHSKFKKHRGNSHQIALSQKEVDSLYQLDLSKEPNTDLIRDVFLVGCYTAQRFSDYSRIKKSMIDGELIRITQQKTGAKVVIPMNTQLGAILLKYNYTLPKVSEQDLNYNIKLIARRAKITKLENWNEVIRKVISSQSKERCTLISSHTARRTGATLMHEAGLTIATIMNITGHKSETQLRTYLKLDKDKSAIEALKNDFFNRKVK